MKYQNSLHNFCYLTHLRICYDGVSHTIIFTVVTDETYPLQGCLIIAVM